MFIPRHVFHDLSKLQKTQLKKNTSQKAIRQSHRIHGTNSIFTCILPYKSTTLKKWIDLGNTKGVAAASISKVLMAMA